MTTSKIYWKDYLDSLNIEKDIHNVCHKCRLDQIKEYGKITIECSGMTSVKDIIPEDQISKISESEMEEFENIVNPYKWAIDTFVKQSGEPLVKNRYYQESLVNCSAKRKVYRCGRRIGKALDINTPIPTPNGFKKMKDISDLDYVFDENGKPTKVKWSGDIMYDRPCYSISFSDGSSVIADEEHEWAINKYHSGNTENYSSYNAKTADIFTDLKDNNNRFKYFIFSTGIVEYEEKKLPIDPYFFGRSIYNNSSVLPVEKIPDEYKFSSYSQRLSLLRGIMDIGGLYIENGVVSYENDNKVLLYDIKSVIESLGMICSAYTTENTFGFTVSPNINIFLEKYNDKTIEFNKCDTQKRRYITKVEKVDSIPVKCISVESESSLYLFGENYNITHNSYSMAISIVEAVLRNEEYRVLVVTPYDVQAEEIFNLVKQLLSNVKGVDSSEIIDRAVSSPTHFIRLKNGSRIRGFTTGPSGAGSVRGQGADEIFLDEVDYMSEKDFNAILAILADAPETKITVASTPDGEKMLHKLSKNPRYKTFHFPTFVLPHYTDELDQDLRDGTDEIGYIQEYMAEFGASRLSVFQKMFINRAMESEGIFYSEDVLSNRERYILALGCDWNHENVGTKICVVAYDKITEKVTPILTDSVAKEGWTQTSAMDKIISINRLYVPDYIYVDEGFGYAQIEMLKRFAIEKYGKTNLDDPDLRLANIIGVNFSSSVKIKDPKTNEEKSKFLKQYMVENATSMFENNNIVLNKDRDKKLEEELTAYIEKSRTPTGRIIYAASSNKIGDHNLDAFMIGLYAIHAENSVLFKNKGMQLTLVSLSQKGNTTEDQGKRPSITNNKELAYFSFSGKNNSTRTKGKVERGYRVNSLKNTNSSWGY